MKGLALFIIPLLLFGCAAAPVQENASNTTTGPVPIPVVNCADICGNDTTQVCGTDGVTYANKCVAECEGAAVSMDRPCQSQAGCGDTNPGHDIYTKGTVQVGGYTYVDRCKSAAEVYQYYCNGSDVGNATVSCPAGSECADGACTSAGNASGCQDTVGNDTSIKGTLSAGGKTYVDVCQGNQTLQKYYCDANGMPAYAMVKCPFGQMCQDGRCVATSSSCTDTDSTKSIFIAGTLTVSSLSFSGIYLDKCIDVQTLRKYYCDGDSYASEVVTCPEGYDCMNGACRPEVCMETNGGNIFQKGVVSVGGQTYTDACVGLNTGTEYYCEGIQVISKTFTCPSGYICSEGQCVK